MAIAWDADGRMFVAEMSDYPTSKEKGKIKLLEDRDHDGRYERITVFADQLSFPNGVMPWNDGVLVTAAPDIWFLKDTNGDGVADQRKKMLTGFGEGNQQLRVNGLHWGLDNWIYGANGRSQGEVRWADPADLKTVSIRGQDFRFRPETRQFETIAGHSQFGLARDDWGNRFLSWNTIPIRHEVLPVRYLNRNRFLASTESLADLLEPDDIGRIYPLSPSPLTFNNESIMQFNALAGLTIYRGHALGAQYRGNAFVGESLRNLVHRRVLEAKGPTFAAHRGEQEKEFLASSDPCFHPVNFATGPDGAFYIVDFYRWFVEHPDFVQGNARNEMPWRTGAERGRIWRVRLKNSTLSQKKIQLSQATFKDLVKELENPHGWSRDTAQRLLVERADVRARPILENLIRKSKMPEARIQGLYVLNALGGIKLEILKAGLNDSHPQMRRHALRLTEDFLSNGANRDLTKELSDKILALEMDPDSKIRFQLALTLGGWPDKRKYPVLARLAERDYQDRWHSMAILSSLEKSPWLF